jgi:hypothetical protein
MKTLTTLLITLVSFFLLTGCSKTQAPVVSGDVATAQFLTGVGNKYWHLKEVYVNNVPQVLTDYQMKYTKTYTINSSKPTSGTFTDSDGLTGTWNVTDAKHIEEAFVTGGGVGLLISYTVNDINDTKLDVIYSSNNKLEREVYYAY